jgi:hypothetical protein
MRRGPEAVCIPIITGYSYASNGKVAPGWHGHGYRSGSGTSVRPLAVAGRARSSVFMSFSLKLHIGLRLNYLKYVRRLIRSDYTQSSPLPTSTVPKVAVNFPLVSEEEDVNV